MYSFDGSMLADIVEDLESLDRGCKLEVKFDPCRLYRLVISPLVIGVYSFSLWIDIVCKRFDIFILGSFLVTSIILGV